MALRPLAIATALSFAVSSSFADEVLYTYEGVNHAFHNDTAPTRYDSDAAKLSWKRTIDYLDEKLQSEQ